METEYSLSQFRDTDRLIVEYEEDRKSIQLERLVMKNYPKVFVMSSASFFEFQIKKCLEEFIQRPINSIDTHYLKIKTLRNNNPSKPLVDKIFAKLKGYNDHGMDVLDAEDFYRLFGGTAFKNDIINRVNTLIDVKKDETNRKIVLLEPMLSMDEKYEYEYAKLTELKEQLDRCTFANSEQSYLAIKMRRNRVAHDYLNGLSDTFEDLQKFYNLAVLYIVAVENAIMALVKEDDA